MSCRRVAAAMPHTGLEGQAIAILRDFPASAYLCVASELHEGRSMGALRQAPPATAPFLVVSLAPRSHQGRRAGLCVPSATGLRGPGRWSATTAAATPFGPPAAAPAPHVAHPRSLMPATLTPLHMQTRSFGGSRRPAGGWRRGCNGGSGSRCGSQRAGSQRHGQISKGEQTGCGWWAGGDVTPEGPRPTVVEG